MKDIVSKINEALHSKNWLENAKNNEEPFVKAALEDEGWTVTIGSQDEDFNGIDLKVEKKETDDQYGGKFNLDVKGSSDNNKKSKNFLFTIKSASGKEYPFKDNNFLAFIDYEDKTIALCNQKDLKELAKKYTERDSKFGDSSKYVLLPKQEVKKLGRIINPSDKIKKMLK